MSKCANPTCNNEFKRHQSQRYCRPECRPKHKPPVRKPRTLKIGKCLTCGSEFKAKTKRSKFCCEDCRLLHAKKEPRDLICEVCGKSYKGAWNSKRCSYACNITYLEKKKIPEEYIDVKVCPLTDACFEASQINCGNREFRICNLFIKSVYEKRARACRAT